MGSVYAMYKLGEVYHNCEQYIMAKQYYNAAIKANCKNSYFNMGIMYMRGEGVSVNNEKATELFEKALQLGHTKAMSILGNVYMNIVNCKQKAIQCMLTAINDNNDSLSAYNLGIVFQKKESHVDAIKWLLVGAKQEHLASQQELLDSYGIINYNITEQEISDLVQLHEKMR